MVNATDNMWRAVMKKFVAEKNGSTAKPKEVLNPQTGECQENCEPTTGLGLGITAMSIASISNGILTGLMAVVFLVLVGIPILALILFFLATVYGVHLVIAVGVIFGPILICWLPWKPLSHLAENWIKFMMTQGLTYAVAICLAAITIKGVESMKASMTAEITGFSDLFVVFLPYCLMAGLMVCFMAWLQSRADNIADALMNGKSESGGGFAAATAAGKSGIAKKTMRGAGKAASGAASGAAAAAKGTASMAKWAPLIRGPKP
jgi:hypothetical protein